MTTAEMHSELRRMAKPSFVKCAEGGYWFCERCQRVINNLSDDNDSPAVCPKCHRRTVVWQKPVF